MNQLFTSNGNPRLSIIVAVKNLHPHVRACFSSLRANLACSRPGEAEVLVVLPAEAKEDLSGLLAAMHLTARVEAGPPGLMNALNHGVSVAYGRYIVFLHSDDEWSADYLAALTKEIDNCEKRLAGVHFVIYTTVAFIDERGQTLFVRKPPRYYEWIHKRASVIMHPNAVYPADLLRQVPFQVDKDGTPMDRENVIALLRVAKPVRLKMAQYRFRLWGGSTTVRRTRHRRKVSAGRTESLLRLICRVYVQSFESRLLWRTVMWLLGRTYWRQAAGSSGF
jgi:glycosyltransferase involved in cell wall biosynthesis